MKQGRLIMALVVALIMAGHLPARADLVTSVTQVINLHGKTDTGGVVASFNQVGFDGTETPFSLPPGKVLMLTSVSARVLIPGKQVAIYRLKLLPLSQNSKPFFSFGVVVAYDAKNKGTLGALQGENISPGIPIGSDFQAALFDATETNIITTAGLGIRLIGYLVDAP